MPVCACFDRVRRTRRPIRRHRTAGGPRRAGPVARQGRVDKHAKLLVGAGDLGREPVHRELRRCAGMSNSRSAPPGWKGLTVFFGAEGKVITAPQSLEHSGTTGTPPVARNVAAVGLRSVTARAELTCRVRGLSMEARAATGGPQADGVVLKLVGVWVRSVLRWRCGERLMAYERAGSRGDGARWSRTVMSGPSVFPQRNTGSNPGRGSRGGPATPACDTPHTVPSIRFPDDNSPFRRSGRR